MGDKRRFELFADLISRTFPGAARVFDVAGGMGKLNLALTARGCDVTTFDKRWKRESVRYAERLFTLAEPCTCDVVVGMHPDGATRIVVEYAAHHRVPFAIVPCCSDNGMPYKPWVRHLAELGAQLGLDVAEVALPMEGRARVLLGRPR
jgi:sugar phosphate isomerase/epimerase